MSRWPRNGRPLARTAARYADVADPARVRDPNRKGTVEHAIGHTPMGSKLSISTGDAFDVKVQPVMEGRKGQPSRALRPYDRAARALIDTDLPGFGMSDAPQAGATAPACCGATMWW